MSAKSALGKGLGSLIPQKQSMTEQVIPEARREILDIPVGDIRENTRQPRQYFSPADLEDLIGSIKEHGVLQPLIVTQINGEYELIAGERRLRASRTLGLKTVPAIVRNVNEQEKLELALIENIQRQDLNAVEEAIAYRALIDEFNLTQEDVAKRVGKSRSNVANILRLLDLDEEILTALKRGEITKTHGRTLLAEKNTEKRHALFLKILEGGVSVQEVEARVSRSGAQKKHLNRQSKDPNVMAHEKRLREILETKVDIQESSGKGKIVISFYSREELMDLLDRLMD
jgi:ParB family transcriptional regulator, chromosome partitioning protein